jgi:hypothetical protein
VNHGNRPTMRFKSLSSDSLVLVLSTFQHFLGFPDSNHSTSNSTSESNSANHASSTHPTISGPRRLPRDTTPRIVWVFKSRQARRFPYPERRRPQAIHQCRRVPGDETLDDWLKRNPLRRLRLRARPTRVNRHVPVPESSMYSN